MKKRLFSVVSVFALFAYNVNAQQTATLTVKSNTDVKVTSGALLYVNGEMKVDNYTSPDKKVSNSGNIKITKKLTNAKVDGTNFVNELDGTGKYGQLIVSNGSGNENTGKITSVLKFKDGFGFYPLAIPYKGINASDVVTDLFGSSKVTDAFPGYHGTPQIRRGFDAGRAGNALFYWDNDIYSFTQLAKDDNIGVSGTETRYYAVNNTTLSNAGKLSLSEKKSIKGTPLKDDITVTLKKYETLENKNARPEDSGDKTILNGTNVAVNKYGEAYGSYLVDFATAMPSGWENYFDSGMGVKTTDFGLRVYNLGNPYTSNIDLVKLLKESSNADFKNNVQAIAQYGKQDYNTEINTYGGKVSGSAGKLANFSGLTKDGTGDTNLSIVAPFQTFAVKMTSDMNNTVTLTFNDNVKTFKGTGEKGTGAVFNTVFAKGGKKGAQINQVALDLLDENGDITGLRTYVVASDIYEASQKGEGTELYNPKLTEENTGIYTLQEKEDGSIDESLANNKAYINGVNADKYIGKPIHLVVQNGKGQYTLRTRLNEDLSKNKNAFYFEDKKTGKIAKVDKNFAYTFNANGTEKDRFVLYWARTPKNNQVKDMVEDAVDATNIVKSGDNFLVLFSKGISTADVFVYNISGQLISAERNVNAKQPHTLYIKGNSSVYVVKVVGDNGKVVTKKIIK